MQSIDLSGKRVLLTQASDFMGPALAEVFRECGADLISADGLVAEPDYPQRLLAESGAIDVLLLNLGIPAPTTAAPEVMDDEWRHAFSAMVDPLPRFARAVLPQMLARGSGKILLIGSASALRGMRRAASQSSVPRKTQTRSAAWSSCERTRGCDVLCLPGQPTRRLLCGPGFPGLWWLGWPMTKPSLSRIICIM